MRKNVPDARNRILQTAVRIFAEKSFEGARIDEIAREAGVPKSLIYYHFKSKDEILEVLTKNFIDEYTAIISKCASETHQAKAEGLPARMENTYYEFGLRNADLLRVIMIDSLKKTKEKPVLFNVVEALINVELQYRVANDGADTDGGYDIAERLIAEFFTSFIPNCAFICFEDAWLNYFSISKEAFEKKYIDIYSQTHGAYHKNHP